MKDYCYYLKVFLENVLITDRTKYECRESVIAHNRATDKYRNAAYMIGHVFPEKINDFAELLQSDHICVRLSCAVCIVELMPADSALKTKAIQQVKAEIEKGTASPEYGWILWLKRNDISKKNP
jgi:hypothetical protein